MKPEPEHVTRNRREIVAEVAGVAGAVIALSAIVALLLKEANDVNVASSAAFVAIGTAIGSIVLSSRIRRRQACAMMRDVLKEETGLRTSLDEPKWIVGKTAFLDDAISEEGRAAIAAIMDKPCFNDTEPRVLVHPLPKSATLRAAMLRDGDPMDRR